MLEFTLLHVRVRFLSLSLSVFLSLPLCRYVSVCVSLFLSIFWGPECYFYIFIFGLTTFYISFCIFPGFWTSGGKKLLAIYSSRIKPSIWHLVSRGAYLLDDFQDFMCMNWKQNKMKTLCFYYVRCDLIQAGHLRKSIYTRLSPLWSQTSSFNIKHHPHH